MSEYINIRHELSKAFNNLAEFDDESFELTVMEIVRLLPFADHCSTCDNGLMVWPQDRNHLGKCSYICPVCESKWTVGFYGGLENKCVFIATSGAA